MQPFGPTLVAKTTKIKLKGCHGYSLMPDKPPYQYTFEIVWGSGNVGFKSGDFYLSGKESTNSLRLKFSPKTN